MPHHMRGSLDSPVPIHQHEAPGDHLHGRYHLHLEAARASRQGSLEAQAREQSPGIPVNYQLARD